VTQRIYLDACCLNRPFDDQTQGRIRLETEALVHLLRAVEEGKVVWVASDAVAAEISRCPDEIRRSAVEALLARATERGSLSKEVLDRAKVLRSFGLKDFDAMHLALAEAAGVTVLVTTDDRFIAAAGRLGPPSAVRVLNPVALAAELLQ